MSIYRRSQALVLRREVLGESDRRYTLLTPAYGRIVVKARGTQKMVSKLAGTLEPPALIEAAFVIGRQLHTLIAADTLKVFPTITHSAERLSQISFINETVHELIGEGQGDTHVWELVQLVYDELEQQRMVSPILGAFFVVRLLTLLGLAPDFGRDAASGSSLEARQHRFSLHHGGLVAATDEKDALVVSPNAIKILRLLQQGDLETVRRIKAGEATVREVSRVAARLLAFHRPEAAHAMAVMQALAQSAR